MNEICKRIQPCGGTWAYCDGDCESCTRTHGFVASTMTEAADQNGNTDEDESWVLNGANKLTK